MGVVPTASGACLPYPPCRTKMLAGIGTGGLSLRSDHQPDWVLLLFYHRSVSFTQRESGSNDSLQLYYRSCVDMLVSFMLQQQHPPGHGSSGQHGSSSASVQHTMSLARSGDAAGPNASPFSRHHVPELQSLLGQSLEEEVHLVTSGRRATRGVGVMGLPGLIGSPQPMLLPVRCVVVSLMIGSASCRESIGRPHGCQPAWRGCLCRVPSADQQN